MREQKRECAKDQNMMAGDETQQRRNIFWKSIYKTKLFSFYLRLKGEWERTENKRKKVKSEKFILDIIDAIE